MSRCSDLVSTPAKDLCASDHAPHYNRSIARLNYLCSADQYLSCAARILPVSTPHSLFATVEQIKATRSNTRTVLKDLHDAFFHDLYKGPGREDVWYGCRDYHTFLCNILNTFITHYDILYPLLRHSPWIFADPESDRFQDFRLRLEKEMKKRRKVASLIGARFRYGDTDTTSNNLKVAIGRYMNLCEYVSF